MSTAKDDCENLLGQLMPFIEEALGEYHEFFPVGVAMTSSQEVEMLAAEDGEAQPESEDLIDMLKQGFREGGESGEYRATCLAFDATATHPETDVEQDTVMFLLDHQDSYSVKVCFPYSFDADDKLVIEEPYAVEGDYDIFAKTSA